MEYKGKIQTKIVRYEHDIYIYLGGTAKALKKALSSVPDDTKLTEIIESEAGNSVNLMFEKEEKG